MTTGGRPTLASNGTDRSWMARAACKGLATSVFFPEKTKPGTYNDISEARAVCDTCPVTTECHGYAEAESIEAGVWGGQLRQPRKARTCTT